MSFLPKLLPRLLMSLGLLSGVGIPVIAQTISTLVSVAPCRIIDTRNDPGPLGGPSLAAQGTRDIPVPANTACGIPSNALAYSLNVTVVPHGPLEYLTLWPTGQTMPLASTLNAFTGAVTANAAIVPAGTNGSVSVFVTGNTDLILDINGYFVGQALPVMPTIPPFPTIPTIPTVVTQSSSSVTQNTAIGVGASSSGGAQNTAVGSNALAVNSTGAFDTAVGSGALAANVSGNENTAVGTNSLSNSASGAFNATLGSHSLEGNTGGNHNTAVGYSALAANTTGLNNVAVGSDALQMVSTGTDNIALGNGAGNAQTTGSFNVDIANPGVAGESGVIRIGTAGVQNSIYIPAIRSNPFISSGNAQMLVDPNGKVGYLSSSRRYKEDIQDIGDQSNAIFQLRPVQFRYKQAGEDGTKPLQYGLIAEEVEAIYPQLIFRNKAGQVDGVQYQQLPAMMLNEIAEAAKDDRATGRAIQN